MAWGRCSAVMTMSERGGRVFNPARMKVGPCSYCPEQRVVLAVQDDAGKPVFFCRGCIVRLQVTGPDGIVRDPTNWPDLIGTEAN